MTLIKSMIIAFSTYSKIPMPGVEWNDKNRKYALIFFPFIGAVTGLVLCGWWWLSACMEIGILLKSAVSLVIPVMISGGIHLDGFIDTLDALNSYQTRERKLEILKDSHIGAFALIGCCIYFILYFAALTELREFRSYLLLSVGFVLSRALSGLSLVLFPAARKEGLLYSFSSVAYRKITGIFLSILILACAAILFWLDAVGGIVLSAAAALSFFYYRRVSFRQFGGITGDLAGFFLQVCELAMVLGTAVIV